MLVIKLIDKLTDLHIITLLLCTIIFVSAFIMIFYSLFEHRKSKVEGASNFHKSIVTEIIWTILPFIIVVLMALPATKSVLGLSLQ
ncbi:MAG: cytochrome c oxidase subunit II transmembrane domain-containing protein [Burkholderia sp.]|nr:cytochrome c oxidase subunit II transmembrane domain-containing protein [Burkholderia sp.]